MNYLRINKINRRQLQKMLRKEGIEVGDWFDSKKTYTVLFRRIARSESPSMKVRIFYPAEYTIDIGTVITINQEPYIIYSMDALESNVYKTSVAVKCDGIIPVLKNNTVVELPFVLLSDTWKVSHKTISTVTGATIIYTPTNEYSDLLAVNYELDKFGNHYQIVNRFKNQGLTYLNLEQTLRPPDNYSITYTGDTTIDMLDTQYYQMDFTVLNNGAVVDPQPTLTYTSSDSSVATIDNSGVLTPISVGNTDITATYTDGNVSRVVTISITNSSPQLTFTVIHSGASNVIKAGGTFKTLTVKVFDQGGNDITAAYWSDSPGVLTWSASSPQVPDINDYLIWDSGDEINQIKIKLSYDYSEGRNNDIRVNALIDGVVVAGDDLVTDYL